MARAAEARVDLVPLEVCERGVFELEYCRRTGVRKDSPKSTASALRVLSDLASSQPPELRPYPAPRCRISCRSCRLAPRPKSRPKSALLTMRDLWESVLEFVCQLLEDRVNKPGTPLSHQLSLLSAVRCHGHSNLGPQSLLRCSHQSSD